MSPAPSPMLLRPGAIFKIIFQVRGIRQHCMGVGVLLTSPCSSSFSSVGLAVMTYVVMILLMIFCVHDMPSPPGIISNQSANLCSNWPTSEAISMTQLPAFDKMKDAKQHAQCGNSIKRPC